MERERRCTPGTPEFAAYEERLRKENKEREDRVERQWRKEEREMILSGLYRIIPDPRPTASRKRSADVDRSALPRKAAKPRSGKDVASGKRPADVERSAPSRKAAKPSSDEDIERKLWPDMKR